MMKEKKNECQPDRFFQVPFHHQEYILGDGSSVTTTNSGQSFGRNGVPSLKKKNQKKQLVI